MSTALWVCLAVFLVCTPLARPFIDWLLAHGIGKRIRGDGPATHLAKAGTATMGGLLPVAAGAVVGVVLLALGYSEVLWPWLAMLAFGVLGVFDDLKGLRDTAGVGWLARSKFPWQWVVGGALALFVYLGGAAGSLWLPWASQRLDLGLAFIPLGALLLVGWVNATNLADGLDGLAGGMSAMVLGALAALALMQGHAAVAWWTAAVAGGTLAFLWYNVNPARVFMGDVGAEGLGAAMAMVALVTGHALLLVIAGLVFVAVALSVMIQVSWFKYTRRRYGEGRRVFRMTPLHHHFEQLGWAEVQITQRFWLVTAVAIVLAFALWGTTG